MEYASFKRSDAQGHTFHANPGQCIGGLPIGIVVLDLWYPYLPGNVANATSYDFPVHYKVLEGCTGPMILEADEALMDPIIEAGREFQQQGIRALVGACGYFANYQREVSAALDIPVFLSSLLQAPMIHRSLKPDQSVGILFADATAVTGHMLESCGVTEDIPVEYLGMEDQPGFQSILQCTGEIDYDEMEGDLVNRARELVRRFPHVGAILLECSDMPPFAWAIQQAVALPVFDFNSLINWVHYGMVQHRYEGHL